MQTSVLDKSMSKESDTVGVDDQHANIHAKR